MMALFDEEYILKTYIESKEREAAEKAAERAAKKAADIAKDKTKLSAQKLYKSGNPVEYIAEVLDVPPGEVEQWVGLVTV